MGRATVVSSLGEGRFAVTIDFGSEIRDQLVAAWDQYIVEVDALYNQAVINRAEYDAKIAETRAAVDDALLVVIAAQEALLAVQETADEQELARLKKELEDAIKSFTRALSTAQLTQGEADYIDTQKARYLSDKLQAQRTRTYIASFPVVVSRNVWCADYRQTLSGTKAAIEINGEPELTLIAPRERNWNPEQDGYMFARELGSPEQVFFNVAILPGWQKWLPTYRLGTITALDKELDLATVALAPASSSAQGLNVNLLSTLEDIAVDYMECNASAFEVGDRVVVEFPERDWIAPKVIGFLDNPRPCRKLSALAYPLYDLTDFWNGETVPGGTAPDSPEAPDWPQAFLGWHIQWSNTTNSTFSRSYLLDRELPAVDPWLYDEYPYDQRIVEAQYYLPDRLISLGPLFDETSRSIREEVVGSTTRYYVTGTFTITDPVYYYGRTSSAIGQQVFEWVTEGLVGPETAVPLGFDPDEFPANTPEYIPVVEHPAPELSQSGTTPSYGMPFAYTTTWKPEGTATNIWEPDTVTQP